MNDMTKTIIKNKLEKAMEAEDIRNSDAARIFGINPNYIWMIKNPNTLVKCPVKGWKAVLKWVNSGQGMKEYSEKHGKVIIESKNPESIPVISKEVMSEPVKDVIKTEPEKVIQQLLRETKCLLKKEGF